MVKKNHMKIERRQFLKTLGAATVLGGHLKNAPKKMGEKHMRETGNHDVAVIGAGVVLTRGTPVYDLERQTVHRAENGKPLVIPENAVVVPGARAVKGEWGQAQGISLQTPVIVKYRDEKTDAATALESWLR